MEHKRFMSAAIRNAKERVRNPRESFAACVVKGGKLIGIGHNTAALDHDVMSHGEVNAIRGACKTLGKNHLHEVLEGCTLYSTCEPCSLCFGATKHSGIKRIVYGISKKDLDDIQEGKRVHSRRKVRRYRKEGIEMVGNFMRNECLALFEKN